MEHLQLHGLIAQVWPDDCQAAACYQHTRHPPCQRQQGILASANHGQHKKVWYCREQQLLCGGGGGKKNSQPTRGKGHTPPRRCRKAAKRCFLVLCSTGCAASTMARVPSSAATASTLPPPTGAGNGSHARSITFPTRRDAATDTEPYIAYHAPVMSGDGWQLLLRLLLAVQPTQPPCERLSRARDRLQPCTSHLAHARTAVMMKERRLSCVLCLQLHKRSI